MSLPEKFSEFSLEFKQKLVPQVSQQRYKQEWAKYKKFLEDNGAANSVTETTLQAYLLTQHKEGLSPTTLRTHCSMLKKMTLCENVPQPDHVWKKLKGWWDNLVKNYVPEKAAVFTSKDLAAWINDSPEENPVQVQKKCLAVVAYCGGLRSQEDYNLTWEDFSFNEKDKEVVVKVKETKGNFQGRCFLVSDWKHYSLLDTYRKTFEKPTGFFYRAWNVRFGKWNKTRRGIKFFQLVPKEIARALNFSNVDAYTHHAFRRTLASSLHEAGATRQMIKRAGGWQSDKVVEGYIAESVGEKRKCADLLINHSNKKACRLNLSGTFHNCTFNIK